MNVHPPHELKYVSTLSEASVFRDRLQFNKRLFLNGDELRKEQIFRTFLEAFSQKGACAWLHSSHGQKQNRSSGTIRHYIRIVNSIV